MHMDLLKACGLAYQRMPMIVCHRDCTQVFALVSLAAGPSPKYRWPHSEDILFEQVLDDSDDATGSRRV